MRIVGGDIERNAKEHICTALVRARARDVHQQHTAGRMRDTVPEPSSGLSLRHSNDTLIRRNRGSSLTFPKLGKSGRFHDHHRHSASLDTINWPEITIFISPFVHRTPFLEASEHWNHQEPQKLTNDRLHVDALSHDQRNLLKGRQRSWAPK